MGTFYDPAYIGDIFDKTLAKNDQLQMDFIDQEVRKDGKWAAHTLHNISIT